MRGETSVQRSLDRIIASLDRILFNQGYHKAQMQTLILAQTFTNPKPKRLFSAGMLTELSRAVARTILAFMTPYILAGLSGMGALIVGLWKAFTRGWLSF